MKKGSALLVVLGMMAFIVVSAVAFSAYMRYSRLPSSYLRRTSSSRLLVKAALAEAINAVDIAIGNNPYPGVGGNDANRWQSRVFMGSGTSASTDDTVSTLTMEGLAYIPPAFINEVRYYSRRTPTAEWQTLNYDAGRFAYCAVDVSDCFDVNRLSANVGRDSSDANRITLSHCFENPNHTGYTIQPSAWDDFMKDYSTSSGKKTNIPLVSLADFNLAVNAEGGLDELSPFCAYLKQSGNAKMVARDALGSDATALVQRNLAFVTDTLFLATNTTSASVVDLSRQSDQPFYGMRMMKSTDNTKNADTFDQMVDGANQKFRNVLSVPEVAQLYDYLDRDSVPLSLALPTTERVPMVTGVALNGSVSVVVSKKVENSSPPATGTGTTTPPTITVTAGKLILAGEIGVRAGFVYPFKHSRGTTPSFKAQAAVTVTLVPEGSEKSLRRSRAVSPIAFVRGDWTTSKKNPTAAKIGSEDIAVVITMQSETKKISVGSNVSDEEDAVCSDLTFNFTSFSQPLIPSAPLPDDPLMTGATFSDDVKKTTFRKIVKTDSDGTVVGQVPLTTTLQLPNADLSALSALGSGAKYVPVVQVWIRVLDENDKTVDLVPAYYNDDERKSNRLTDIRSAALLPLVRFSQQDATAIALTYDDSVFDFGDKQMTPYPQAYLADDPRFNFAPENLMAIEDLGGDFKAKWFATQRSKSRDGDLFMATSDAGYLQSVYELSFVNDMKLAIVNASTYNGNIRTSFGDTPANEAMWTTYSQVKIGDSNGGEIDDILPFADNGRGFRVNPYTDDVNILMAALANTPMDWWAASTNNLGDAVKQKMVGTGKLSEANKYTFSQFATDEDLKVKHGTEQNYKGTLTELAQQFKSVFRNAGSNWQNAFDRTVNWNGEDEIAGVDLGVTLHNVDKKYLHAFWRGCFANRQHLFLIFVRAEPMMMGGGALGQTPPQLGARAVALVWRDPTEVRNTASSGVQPHRTRILFYRQFE